MLVFLVLVRMVPAPRCEPRRSWVRRATISTMIHRPDGISKKCKPRKRSGAWQFDREAVDREARWCSSPAAPVRRAQRTSTPAFELRDPRAPLPRSRRVRAGAPPPTSGPLTRAPARAAAGVSAPRPTECSNTPVTRGQRAFHALVIDVDDRHARTAGGKRVRDAGTHRAAAQRPPPVRSSSTVTAARRSEAASTSARKLGRGDIERALGKRRPADGRRRKRSTGAGETRSSTAPQRRSTVPDRMSASGGVLTGLAKSA